MGENVGNDNHDTKMLRRDLKRAKVFAIHYLTRRIRLLKNKRGTEQQIEKNTRKAGRFQEEIECIKDLDVNIVLKKIDDKLDIADVTQNGFQDVEERALARLMSSKPIQNRLKDTTDKKDISRSPDTTDVLSITKIRQKSSAKLSWKKSKSKTQNLSSTEQTITSSDDALDSSEENSDEDLGMERMSTSFFVESMASFMEDDDDADETKKRKEKKDKKGTKRASNRLGQRARQRLWKDRYGKLANHVKSDDKIKRTRKREKLKPDQKRTKQAKIAKPKKGVQETASHPSWEASKRRKLEQNISQTQFQGEKIIFEDSD